MIGALVLVKRVKPSLLVGFYLLMEVMLMITADNLKIIDERNKNIPSRFSIATVQRVVCRLELLPYFLALSHVAR